MICKSGSCRNNPSFSCSLSLTACPLTSCSLDLPCVAPLRWRLTDVFKSCLSHRSAAGPQHHLAPLFPSSSARLLAGMFIQPRERAEIMNFKVWFSKQRHQLQTTWHFPAVRSMLLILYIFLHGSVSAALKCPTPGMQTAGPFLFMSCIVAAVGTGWACGVMVPHVCWSGSSWVISTFS